MAVLRLAGGGMVWRWADGGMRRLGLMVSTRTLRLELARAVRCCIGAKHSAVFVVER
jgi:hypothetical protein